MGSRVFIGLRAGEAFRKKAATCRELHTGLPVRWIPPENLHVTLVPPWYCDDTGEVCRKLHDHLDGIGAFDVCFNLISVGPTARKPRLIWASGGAHRGLGELQAILSGLVDPAAAPAGRTFLLHVTLARMKGREKVRFSPEEVDWRIRLDSVCLYESILLPSGAEYRVLCTAGLST